MLVFVLNKDGKNLMPCSPRKARVLLKDKKAKVMSRKPFTIQLLYGSSGYKQSVFLGIDRGSHYTGISCVSNGKVVFSVQINHRINISKQMDGRKGNRRHRRSKLWYRKPRFLNRVSSRRVGRLPPSIKANVEEILRVIKKIKLPVSNVIVEDVQVDIEKLNDPNISKKSRKDPKRLDENLRIACLMRDGYACKHCGVRNVRFEAHHIQPTSKGGKDTIKNLITLCDKCHEKLHKGEITISGGVGGFRDKIAQRAMQGKSYLYRELSKISILDKVYGYETSVIRKGLGLNKDHDIDAMCVILAKYPQTIDFNRDNYYNVGFRAEQTRRQYHDLPRKGKGRVKYQVNDSLGGFKKGDIVLVKGFEKQITSIWSTGNLAFKRVKGEPSTCIPSNCKLLEKQKTIIFSKNSNV